MKDDVKNKPTVPASRPLICSTDTAGGNAERKCVKCQHRHRYPKFCGAELFGIDGNQRAEPRMFCDCFGR